MPRFHIDIHDKPVRCPAKKKCRKEDADGNTAEHFEGTLEEAKAWAEEKLSKELGSEFTSIENKDKSISHISTEEYGNLSDKEVEEILEQRTESPYFRKLIAIRDEKRRAFEESKEKSKKSASAYYRNKIENNHGKLRKARNDEREAYYDFMDSNLDLEQYKDQTALVAARLSESAFEKEYEGNELMNAVKTVEYPSGSREWLEQRQGGIGGSDAGAIFGVGKWAKQNYKQVWESKVFPITDKEVEEQANNNTDFSGPAGRGNAWEPLIAKKFSDKNPDYELLHSKSSWVNKDKPWQFANFDGILRNKKTGEYEILEIKTSSNANDWKNGIPDNYRVQVLHYMNATGIKKGHVAVLIDDHEYRSYEIYADEPVDKKKPEKGSYEERIKELEDFYLQAQESKKGDDKKIKQKSDFKFSSQSEKNIVIRNLAAFRQEPEDEVRERIENRIAGEKKEVNKRNKSIEKYNKGKAKEDKKPLVKVNYNSIIKEEYASFNPLSRKKDTVSIDIETSSGSSARGEIIEVGVLRTNAKGEVVDQYQALFDIDNRAKRFNGTGPEEVHNISVKDIEGKPRFTNNEVQSRMREIMGINDGNTVMLAHNAAFEKRFLNQYLEGFHKSKIDTVDTMQLARYFEHDSDSNTLESFAQSNQVEYKDAHRALVDAKMTQEAYENFIKKITG